VEGNRTGVEVEIMMLEYIKTIFIGITAMAGIYFGWKQYQINKRMKELADYVAVSIIPLPGFQLQIKNVGRINLYLHKWEVASLQETYVKPWLLPVDAKSSINLSFSSPPVGQHLLKLYLTDENNRKFLTTGEVVIEPVGVQIPHSSGPSQPPISDQPTSSSPQVSPQINVALRMRAWAYKTERYDWI